MPEDSPNTQRLPSNGLAMALAIAVGVAVMMVTFTTISFFKSSAYNTVKQIQTGNKFVRSIDKDTIDTISPINASDIDDYAQSIRQRLKTLDDEGDFGPSDVSDAALGLY